MDETIQEVLYLAALDAENRINHGRVDEKALDGLAMLLRRKGVMASIVRAVIADKYRPSLYSEVLRAAEGFDYGAYRVRGGVVSANRRPLIVLRGDEVFAGDSNAWHAGKEGRRDRDAQDKRAAAEIREILWGLPLSWLVEARKNGGLEGLFKGYNFQTGQEGGTARRDGTYFGTGRAIREVLEKRQKMLEPSPLLRVTLKECLEGRDL